MIAYGPFRVTFYHDGEVIFRQGEESRSLYLIKQGEVRVYNFDKLGAKVQICLLGINQILGEMAFIDNSPRSAWAEAVGKVEVVEMPTENLQDMLQRQPAWVRALLQSLVTRLRQANTTMQDLNEKVVGKNLARNGL